MGLIANRENPSQLFTAYYIIDLVKNNRKFESVTLPQTFILFDGVLRTLKRYLDIID